MKALFVIVVAAVGMAGGGMVAAIAMALIGSVFSLFPEAAFITVVGLCAVLSAWFLLSID